MMLKLTRLSGEEFLLNPHLLELVETMPDTVVVLTTGRRLVVRESVDSVRMMFMNYQRALRRSGIDFGERRQ